MLQMSRTGLLGLALLVAACSDDTTTPSPAIYANPTTVVFAAEAGGANPAAQTVNVVNTGGGSLTGLSASIDYEGDADGWLTATLNGTSAPTTITLTPSTGTLTDGTYRAYVELTAASARNTPLRMPVRFNIAFSEFTCVPQGGQRVCTFRYRPPEDAPTVDAISVPGMFNGWNPGDSPMTLQDGVWSRSYTLDPGEYEYKYHINGNWIDNMCNDGTWGNPARDNWVHSGATGCRGGNAYVVIE